MSLAHHFLTMAYNNAWANHRLLAACEQLDQEAFIAPRTNFFPSLKATLNHLLLVDLHYLDLLERDWRGEGPNPDAQSRFADEEPCADALALRDALAAAGRRLIDYCSAVEDADLDVPLFVQRGEGGAYGNRTRLLAHLFQHQIHHRGQVHAMLAGTTVVPPSLDAFFRADDVEARAREFRELGWTEQEVWLPRHPR